MQAKTEFEATRQHIVFAFKTFSEGFALRQAKVEADREAWIEAKIKKARFNKNREYWTDYANGRVKGDAAIRSYLVDGSFADNVPNYHWFKARLERASALLARFDCAVDQLNAFEVKISNNDLTLLSTDLDDALSPNTK